MTPTEWEITSLGLIEKVTHSYFAMRPEESKVVRDFIYRALIIWKELDAHAKV